MGNKPAMCSYSEKNYSQKHYYHEIDLEDQFSFALTHRLQCL